jgi:hypothetical protein
MVNLSSLFPKDLQNEILLLLPGFKVTGQSGGFGQTAPSIG